MTLEMFAYDDSDQEKPEEVLNRHILNGDAKQAVLFLRLLDKQDLFEALGRNRFTLCGNTKNELINYVQNELIKRCQGKARIEIVR